MDKFIGKTCTFKILQVMWISLSCALLALIGSWLSESSSAMNAGNVRSLKGKLGLSVGSSIIRGNFL